MMPIMLRSSLKTFTAIAALSALAGCVVGPQNGEFHPAPAADAAPAPPAAAPIEVAALDPLNAPPPATPGDAMLVPPPGGDANTSQRVPLNSLNAAPSAPTSLLQPAGQPVTMAQTVQASPPAPAMPAVQTASAPATTPATAATPQKREFEPAPVAPPAGASDAIGAAESA